MSERKVTVWGDRYTIIVERKSKAVWVASGEYLGESKQVQDRSEGSAIKRWINWATSKGNP
jgi:hypothetical protein